MTVSWCFVFHGFGTSGEHWCLHTAPLCGFDVFPDGTEVMDLGGKCHKGGFFITSYLGVRDISVVSLTTGELTFCCFLLFKPGPLL